MKLKFKERLWEHEGAGAWHFITVPREYWGDIKTITSDSSAGFGSVKVQVSIGKSKWKTSIFPDNKTETFVLPVKKEVRTINDIKDGDTVEVDITIL